MGSVDAEHLLARNHHPLAVACPLRSPSARAQPAHPLLALMCAFLLFLLLCPARVAGERSSTPGRLLLATWGSEGFVPPSLRAWPPQARGRRWPGGVHARQAPDTQYTRSSRHTNGGAACILYACSHTSRRQTGVPQLQTIVCHRRFRLPFCSLCLFDL